MIRRKASPAALIVLALIAATPAVAADAIFPLGFRIGIVPPPGLAPSQTFPGFEDADKKVAIALSELPLRAYQDIERAIFAAGVAQPMVIERREMLPIETGMGFLATGHQESNGVRFRKWLLLTQAGDLTALITVQRPDDASEAYPDAVIRAALKSTTARPNPLDEQIGMLPFRLDELAGFRVVRALPAGALVLTDGPRDDGGLEQPHVIVSVGKGAPQTAADRATFAQRLLSVTPGLSNFRLTGSEPLRIGGQPGYEVRAEAVEVRSGTPVTLIQWLRLGTSGFVRVVGISSTESWPESFTRFRAVRDGVELR